MRHSEFEVEKLCEYLLDDTMGEQNALDLYFPGMNWEKDTTKEEKRELLEKLFSCPECGKWKEVDDRMSSPEGDEMCGQCYSDNFDD